MAPMSNPLTDSNSSKPRLKPDEFDVLPSELQFTLDMGDGSLTVTAPPGKRVGLQYLHAFRESIGL